MSQGFHYTQHDDTLRDSAAIWNISMNINNFGRAQDTCKEPYNTAEEKT